MSNVLDDDLPGIQIDLIDDTVVTNTNPIEAFGARQLDHLSGERI